MGDLKNMKDGWSNYIKACRSAAQVPKELLELAEARAEVCKTCPLLEKSGLFKFVNRLIPGAKPGDPDKVVRTRFKVSEETAKSAEELYEGYKCGECGCAFPANTFAPDKECPKGKW